MNITASGARQNLFKLVIKVVREHMPIRITSRAGDVVLLSGEDYEGLLETLELLSVPGMRKSIRQARSDIRAGRTKSLKEVFGR